MILPKHISLANLPTKIEKLTRVTDKLNGVQLYIKRDDQTGTEVSGNKIRKLEFVIQDAIDKGCDSLITCGGIQSNHARATAAAAAKLGLKATLVLRSNGEETVEGNYFLDMLFGADVYKISSEDYKDRRSEIMEKIKFEMTSKGYKSYIIPEGASDGIGSMGYIKAMEEIIEQENQLGIKFDAIVTTVGSGGTYSGLFIANKLLKHNSKIYGINICDDAAYFKNRIFKMIQEGLAQLNIETDFHQDDIDIIDGYAGKGYGISTDEELKFIRYFARLEGIVLDPVYTGKAMYGLIEELQKEKLQQHKNILFIHTGGIFGLFPKSNQFFDKI